MNTIETTFCINLESMIGSGHNRNERNVKHVFILYSVRWDDPTNNILIYGEINGLSMATEKKELTNGFHCDILIWHKSH